MPKVTLSFKLPEEQEEYELTMKAGKLNILVYELDQHLRQLTRYAPETQPEEITDAYQKIRNKLYELANELDVDF